jgi:rhodanese-related sulfurtransferase
MKRKLLVVLVLISMGVVWATLANSEDAPRMTKDELKATLGNPDLTIIDVRYGKDWTRSDMKITGAIREEPGKVKSWAVKYPKDKPIVLYCA